ncbi:MAG: DNA topology modulation protein FlaR [Candidatus Coproplasma sp.]
MKICVIGYSGAGKSTLARILGEKYGVPVLHLDSVYWYGDWQNLDFEQMDKRVKEFLSANQNWVIDGNYYSYSPERFAECDMLIFLNYNRFYCFFQALKRYKKYRGTPRPDCPCNEKFDWEFMRWILHDGRTKQKRQKINSVLSGCKGERLIFKNRKKLNLWLGALQIKQN